MVEHIVVRQGLLEHHKFEFVHSFEQADVVERICGIRIAHQQNIAKFFADLFDHVIVPMRRDLDLDAAATRVQFRLNFAKKLLNGILNADRHSAVYFIPDAADVTPERYAELFCFKVPACGFDTRL